MLSLVLDALFRKVTGVLEPVPRRAVKVVKDMENMSDEWLRELWVLIWRKGTLEGPYGFLPQRQISQDQPGSCLRCLK